MSLTRPTPLAGVRVIDMAEGRGEMCGRYLADLGADVVRVEPPGGAASRGQAPLHEGVSLPFAINNLGKRSIVADLETAAGRDRLRWLLDGADIWIETSRPGALEAVGLGPDDARARNLRLVVVSITDFGRTGPYRDWVATDATLLAMGGVLSRSGLPGREPLMPPGELALQATAMQAAWAALVAYWNALETGAGDHIDFSCYEATAQVVDPVLGTVGTAQVAGYERTRDRPAPGPYPIFRCRDGHVRLVLLAPRQWHAMRAWLGEPDELQDPALDTIKGRADAAGLLHAVFEEHFRDRGKHELTTRGPGARRADRARADGSRRPRGGSLPRARGDRACRARGRPGGRRARRVRRARRPARAARVASAAAGRARRRDPH